MLERDLTKGEKIKLRRKRIIEYIASLPAGMPITIRELVEAAGYDVSIDSQKMTGYSMVKTMEKNGVIKSQPDPLEKAKRVWFLPDDGVKTTIAAPPP
jgi:DNA-binding MarR family transcriptional regulator